MMTLDKKYEDELISLRRRLHSIPEIAEQLPLTRKLVREFLDENNIPYTLNPFDDGIIADINGGHDGKTIAFRADMDGLNVVEAGDKPYKSTIEGRMHACGHDAHTAMLLMAAKILNENKASLKGSVRLILQSGEESGSGALRMIDQNVLDGVDAVCGIHVGNLAGDEHSAGDIIVLSGPATAGKSKFTLTVRGKSTHSAFPEKGIDSILIGARIVNACEELLAREIPAGAPATLNFGSFNAGCDHNTIPEKAVMTGSMRVHDNALRDYLEVRLKEVATNIARAFNAECDVDIKKGSATVLNDKELSDFVAKSIKNALGENAVKTTLSHSLMGADDFVHYANRVPSVYFFLHTNNIEKGITATNHNMYFDVDEEVLKNGVISYIAIASDFLK